jgi:hypothetical protein
MSWKFVFNTDHKSWGFIDKANQAAKDSGYQFFTWNGWVYNVDGAKTNVLIEDVE